MVWSLVKPCLFFSHSFMYLLCLTLVLDIREYLGKVGKQWLNRRKQDKIQKPPTNTAPIRSTATNVVGKAFSYLPTLLASHVKSVAMIIELRARTFSVPEPMLLLGLLLRIQHT